MGPPKAPLGVIRSSKTSSPKRTSLLLFMVKPFCFDDPLLDLRGDAKKLTYERTNARMVRSKIASKRPLKCGVCRLYSGKGGQGSMTPIQKRKRSGFAYASGSESRYFVFLCRRSAF